MGIRVDAVASGFALPSAQGEAGGHRLRVLFARFDHKTSRVTAMFTAALHQLKALMPAAP